MADLIAKSPCADLLPVVVGDCSLTEMAPEAITSVMPGAGRKRAVTDALRADRKPSFPAPGRATGREGCRLVWSGAGQALLLGPPPGPMAAATTTDQSDAWAVMRLEGEAAEAVLARLVPIGVRAASFKRGHSARTLLFHTGCSVTRVGAMAFDIMVFRSMADTAVHDLVMAMRSVAAQG